MVVVNNTVDLDLEITRRACSIATTTRNILTLLGCRADATSTTRERRTAALRLALIVLEDEQGVRTGLKLGTHQLLIGRSVAPGRNAILRHHILRVKVANGLIPLSNSTRILQEVIGKALT